MKNYLVSIVIPVYNEVPNYRNGVLIPSFEFLKKQKYDWEMIFVNDGSTDDSRKELVDFINGKKNLRIIDVPHGGKPAAVSAGIMEAKGDFILTCDFDQSTPMKYLDDFLDKMKNDHLDVVIGTRGGKGTKRHDSFFNIFRSQVFALIYGFILLPGIEDYFCGFKLYKRDVIQKIIPNLKISVAKKIKGGYMGAQDPEILYLSYKYHYKIGQVAVDWIRRPTHGNPLKEPLMVFMDMCRIKLADLTRRYKI